MSVNSQAIANLMVQQAVLSQMIGSQGISSPNFTDAFLSSTQLPPQVQAQVKALQAQQQVFSTLINALA